MKCCFCNQEIEKHDYWDKGNNAQPVQNGRCCDECNVKVVIPARLKNQSYRIDNMAGSGVIFGMVCR